MQTACNLFGAAITRHPKIVGPFQPGKRLHSSRGAEFILALALLALGACSNSESVVSPTTANNVPAAKPNIIFLLADDMRWDAAGYAGNKVIQTPNLDALAQQGVSFRNAYVTTSVCAISRASIFTGEYARRHGILNFAADFSQPALEQTYPVLLRSAGYRTGFIGKYGVGNNPAASAFDYWRGFAGQGAYETTDSAGKAIHLTRLMSHQAIAFLDSQPKDKPFSLSVSFKAPHVQDEDPRQFIPETSDIGLYSGLSIPPAPAMDDVNWEAFPAFFRQNNIARERWQTLFSTADKFQASVKGYYRLVTGLDRVVGEIRAELRRLNLDNNTVIIFSSDNGFFMGELGMSHKWYGQDPSIRVPLLVYDPRDPGGQGGRVESAIALNVDIAPTILDIAGVQAPSRMQGGSLVPLVHARGVPLRQDFLYEHMMVDPGIRRSAGVVGGRYKYLKYMDPNPDYEQLYDLATDPNETKNLAGDPNYEAILVQLRERYTELLAQAR